MCRLLLLILLSLGRNSKRYRTRSEGRCLLLYKALMLQVVFRRSWSMNSRGQNDKWELDKG
jgi:hypothetical protein